MNVNEMNAEELRKIPVGVARQVAGDRSDGDFGARANEEAGNLLVRDFDPDGASP